MLRDSWRNQCKQSESLYERLINSCLPLCATRWAFRRRCKQRIRKRRWKIRKKSSQRKSRSKFLGSLLVAYWFSGPIHARNKNMWCWDASRPGAHPKWKSWAPLTCERKRFCGMRRRTVKAGGKATITMLTFNLAIKNQLLTPKMSKSEWTLSTVRFRTFVTRYGRTPLDGKKRPFSRSVPYHCRCWQHQLWQIWSCHGSLTWWSIVFWMVTSRLSQIRMIGVLGCAK